MSGEDPWVRITLRDIYDQVVLLHDQVEKMTPQATFIQDHESRIRALERWRYSLPVAVVLAVVSLIGTITGVFHG